MTQLSAYISPQHIYVSCIMTLLSAYIAIQHIYVILALWHCYLLTLQYSTFMLQLHYGIAVCCRHSWTCFVCFQFTSAYTVYNHIYAVHIYQFMPCLSLCCVSGLTVDPVLQSAAVYRWAGGGGGGTICCLHTPVYTVACWGRQAVHFSLCNKCTFCATCCRLVLLKLHIVPRLVAGLRFADTSWQGQL